MIELKNCSNGEWVSAGACELDVINPATSEVLAQVPVSSVDQVEVVVQHARQAFVQWRRTPVTDRIQYLFRYKQLLEDNLDELARTISLESGKTLAEASGEIRRGIENVEVACGAPVLLQGYNNE
ncbi:MAG: aldehyde dehydrogenase family protein, partial [Pirellulaceae bacterium]